MALTSAKAKKILRDKEVRGKRLTGRQKRFFGLIAGGGRVTRLAKMASKLRKRS